MHSLCTAFKDVRQRRSGKALRHLWARVALLCVSIAVLAPPAPAAAASGLSFSTNATQGWHSISVIVDGQSIGTITSSTPTHPTASCAANSGRVVTAVSPGVRSYYAVADTGAFWLSTIDIPSDFSCYEVVLTCANGDCTPPPFPTQAISLSGDLTFGSVPVGTTATRAFTISNSGNAALTVTSIDYGLDGAFSGNWSGGTIPAGGSQSVAVTFHPLLNTDYTRTIVVNGNQTVGNAAIGASGSGADPLSIWLDLNGDRKSDLLWQNTDGRSVGWLMNGLTATDSRYLVDTPGSGWSIKQVGDFNGDGRSDIVWQHTDGRSAAWLMNGLTATDEGWLIGTPGSGWSIKQIGDFNGDGRSDLLWQNTDGRSVGWLMNGLTATDSRYLVDTPGSGWSIKQVGDFNGDGRSDIVWQHTDGRSAAWLMNGLTATDEGWLIGTPGSGWSVKQIGDFNGDGRSDLLWQNTDGRSVGWLMNGLTATDSRYLVDTPGSGWSIKQVGDFNGDGRSDIVWQHTDGRSAAWLMNGLTATDEGWLIGTPGSGWSVKKIGDFNGDGMNEIVWQHTNGSTALWLMNALAATNSATLMGPGSGWSPAPQ